MATIRLRRMITALAVLVALAATSAAPALATPIRVEGPRATIYQGNLTPATGALKDNQGVTHTTSKRTALGALVAAARATPFPLNLAWSDSFGGGWNGFFLQAVNGIKPPPAASWFTKVNQKLLDVGSGAAVVTSTSNVLVYYSTYVTDPRFETLPTLGLGTSKASTTVGRPVTVTVNQYNDQGVASPGAHAWIWVNGVGTRVDGTGHTVIRLGKPGNYSIRATKQGTIRSRTVWVRVSSS